jgi:hypothetical protein
MQTPTIPSTGPVGMGSIRDAFPGSSNDAEIHLTGFIGKHPDLPDTFGSSISFGQFHGLTAVSPTFTFSNFLLTNGSMTSSNGIQLISGTAGTTKTVAGSISLLNYLDFANFNEPVTFALSNSSSLPSNVSLGTSGILSHEMTNAFISTSNVNIIATNCWGNIAIIPFAYKIQPAIPPNQNK